jgi:hypothetical protein
MINEQPRVCQLCRLEYLIFVHSILSNKKDWRWAQFSDTITKSKDSFRSCFLTHPVVATALKLLTNSPLSIRYFFRFIHHKDEMILEEYHSFGL